MGIFSDNEIHKQWEFADAMLCLANNFPISVTSWGRTQKHNDALKGSVKDSQHIKWLACDIVLDADCDKKGFLHEADTLGLEVIVETDHIHLQWPRK